MTDEKYEFIQDCKNKKAIARSAKNVRTHNGKRGSVKLPSDFMSKEELSNMNGGCKTYRLNSPMSWDEFMEMPDDLKADYIRLIKKKYNASLSAISEMMGVHRTTLMKFIKDNGLNVGSFKSGNYSWDRAGFEAWCSRNKPADDESDELVEPMEEEVPTETVHIFGVDTGKPIEEEAWLDECEEQSCCNETTRVVPKFGKMAFNGNIDDILRTVALILDGKNVDLEVSWNLLEE